MKNPNWERDELILALDFKLKPGQIHAKNPEIIKLSDILNRLPIHPERPDAVRFRNSNGVGLKLSNFLAIDPQYAGKGMAAYAKLDKEVFDEFKVNKEVLNKLATQIRKISENVELTSKLKLIKNESSEEKHIAKEGQILYKLHKYRERNQTLIKKKKEQHYRKYSNLACELCGFDFEKTYGEVGKGFIECHHKTPLAELTAETTNSLDDLILVCSNCHRMFHQGWQAARMINKSNMPIAISPQD